MKLTLYTGPNCCLCDDALAIIMSLNNHQIEVEKVNIRESTELYHLYAVRIPVLKKAASDDELAWPFDKHQLQAFIA
jgi:hypothetical protein